MPENAMTENPTPQVQRRASIGAQRNPQSADAILQAAADLLAEGGLPAFSIEAVARRAKAGKPTIYRWWPSRTALLLDVYKRQKQTAYPDTGAIETDLSVFLTGLFAFWTGLGGTVFRSIIAQAQSDEDAGAALQAYAAERRNYTGQIVRRAQARGEARTDIAPELVAETVSGFAWSRLLTDRLVIEPAEIEGFVRIVCNGIKPR
jgi:AcrR family transcriptional regulator